MEIKKEIIEEYIKNQEQYYHSLEKLITQNYKIGQASIIAGLLKLKHNNCQKNDEYINDLMKDKDVKDYVYDIMKEIN